MCFFYGSYSGSVTDEKDNETFIKITQKIIHDGEVNRARYQIENPDMIATKSRTGDVYLFDRTKFDAMPNENDKFNPTLRLTGHDKEGYIYLYIISITTFCNV